LDGFLFLVSKNRKASKPLIWMEKMRIVYDDFASGDGR